MDCKVILSKKGWFLRDDFIEDSMRKSKRPTAETVVQDALNEDLKEISTPLTETQIAAGVNEISGPLILQIQKIKNVLVSTKYEELGRAGGKFLPKITFTDGSKSMSGIAFEAIPNIKESTPPGTKVQLIGKIPIVQGFLILSQSNTKVLGGKVNRMIDSWNVKRSLASFERAQKKEGDCPPPFVPFNQRRSSHAKSQSYDDFKSFEAKSSTKSSKDDEAFSQQRKATIEAAMGGKRNNSRHQKRLTDEQLAELMQMGFSLEDSVSAGRQSEGNFVGAINILTRSK